MMRFQLILAAISASAVVSVCAAPAGAVSFLAGNNPSGPSSVVSANSGPFGGSPSFSLSIGVIADPTAGNLFKDLTQTSQGSGGPASGIASGNNVPITESLANHDTDAWTAWDERVVTQADFGGGGSGPFGPGFLFDTTIAVLRNGTPLTEGVDYTLTGTPYSNFGNSGYESFHIALAPASYINNLDVLEIHKSLHEVFGDGNVWALNETARLGEFPTVVPEPAALGLHGLIALPTGVLRRRR
jgi:hypothetical protein